MQQNLSLVILVFVHTFLWCEIVFDNILQDTTNLSN